MNLLLDVLAPCKCLQLVITKIQVLHAEKIQVAHGWRQVTDFHDQITVMLGKLIQEPHSCTTDKSVGCTPLTFVCSAFLDYITVKFHKWQLSQYYMFRHSVVPSSVMKC